MNLFFHDSFSYIMELHYAEMTLLMIKATLHLAALCDRSLGHCQVILSTKVNYFPTAYHLNQWQLASFFIQINI